LGGFSCVRDPGLESARQLQHGASARPHLVALTENAPLRGYQNVRNILPSGASRCGEPGMRGGWIRLHRRLLDHWVMQDPRHLTAWLWILMTAPYESVTIRIPGGGITVPRGHVLVSVRHAEREWGVPRSTANRILARLEAEGMLRSVSRHARAGTLYEIVSYEEYQSTDAQRGNGSGGGAPHNADVGPRDGTADETPNGTPRSSNGANAPASAGRGPGQEPVHPAGQDEEGEELEETTSPLTPHGGHQGLDGREPSSAAHTNGPVTAEPSAQVKLPTLRRLKQENGGPVYPAEFNVWWSAHPQHPTHPASQESTYKAWRTIRIGGATVEELNRAQLAFRRSDPVRLGMVTRPDRWLRDGLWREYLDRATSASSSHRTSADEEVRVLEEATARWVESGGGCPDL
jgi:hypothetical protein